MKKVLGWGVMVVTLIGASITNSMGKKHGVEPLIFPTSQIINSEDIMTKREFENLKKLPGVLLHMYDASCKGISSKSKKNKVQKNREEMWYASLYDIKFRVESKQITPREGFIELNDLHPKDNDLHAQDLDSDQLKAYTKVTGLLAYYYERTSK